MLPKKSALKESAPISTKELRDFQSKACSRIKIKIKEDESRNLLLLLEKKKQDMESRERWRQSLKSHRSQSVIDIVDREFVHKTIPDIDRRHLLCKTNKIINFIKEKERSECKLFELISGLIATEDNIVIDRKRDSGVFTMALISEDSGEGKKRSIEFSGRVVPYYLRFLHKVEAFGLLVGHKISREWLDSFGSHYRDLGSIQSTFEGHKNKNEMISNRAQITEMLQSILNDSNLNDNELEEGKVIVGYMGKLLRSARNPIWKVPKSDQSFRERSYSFAIVERLATEGANRTASIIKESGAEYSKVQSVFTSLVDGCFLIGPAKDDIRSELNSRSRSLSIESGLSRLTEKTTNSLTKGNKIVSLKPSILYMQTDRDFPDEMCKLLPAYCFPSQVEATVVVNPPSSRGTTWKSPSSASQQQYSVTSPARSADNQLLPQESTSPSPAVTESPGLKLRKRVNVFQHNDSSKIDGTANSIVQKSLSSNQTRSSKRTVFVLKFGDHTYQRYGICLLQGVFLKDDDANYSVQTQYCLCFLTQLPFINLLIDILERMDIGNSMSNLATPLNEFSLKSPAADNFLFKEFVKIMAKMKSITLPLYPYLVNRSKIAPANQRQEKISDSLKDFFAVFADVDLSSFKRSSEKENFRFDRFFFQRYFSEFSSSFDISKDDLFSHVRLLNRNPSFVPSSFHKGEKEREDNFFILQWALPTLLKYLPLDQIVLALGSAVMEMKLIVKHKDIQVVSGIVFALTSLLRPLKWCYPLIVSLPEEYSDLLDCPMAVIVGLQKLPPNFALQEQCVLIDPELKIIHLHSKDIVQAQTIILPNASKLANSLKASNELILNFAKLSRKRRIAKKKVNLGNVPESSSAPKSSLSTANSSPEGAANTKLEVRNISSGSEQGHVIPLELDSSSDDCAAYMTALMQFTNIVSGHISTLLNTAIQYQHDERQAAKERRRVVARSDLRKSEKLTDKEESRKVTTVRAAYTADTAISAANRPPRAEIQQNSANQRLSSSTESNKPRGAPLQQVGSPNGISQRPTSSKLPTPPTDRRARSASNAVIEGLPKEIYSRNLMDDSISEVTCTDLETEVQPETPREDRENESVNAKYSSGNSIGSSASSIPSLKSGCALFAMKDIGQSGQKFIMKLIETQMFSNYVQMLKEQQPISQFDGSINSIKAAFREDSPHVVSGVAQKQALLGKDSLAMRESDSVVDLCDILLTGSCKTDEREISKYKSIYDEMYANGSSFDWRNAISKVLRVAKKRAPAFAIDRASMKSLSGETLKAIALKGKKKVTISGVDWAQCNGLLCNGFANTSKCGELCVLMWQWKVHVLRNRVAAFQIVSSKFEKRATDNSNSNSNGNSSSAKAAAGPSVEFIAQSGIRLRAIKHGKETESQYKLRHQGIVSSLRGSNEEGAALQKKKRKVSSASVKVVALLPNETGEGKALRSKTLLRKGKGDRYSILLAKYYAKKERKRVRKYCNVCKDRIDRFIRSYVRRYRAARQFQSAVAIQSLYRGYCVRKTLSQLVDMLLARKRLRITSIIRIRNFLRRNAATIARNHERNMQKLLKRRRLPIPIRSSDGVAFVELKDVGMIKANHNVRSLQNEIKYIHEPTFAFNASSPRGKQMPSQAMPPPSIGRGVEASDKGSENKANDHQSGDEQANMPGSRKAATTTFSTAAKEFLQFGKILKRGNNSTFNHPVARRRSLSALSAENELLKKSSADATKRDAPQSEIPIQSGKALVAAGTGAGGSVAAGHFEKAPSHQGPAISAEQIAISASKVTKESESSKDSGNYNSNERAGKPTITVSIPPMKLSNEEKILRQESTESIDSDVSAFGVVSMTVKAVGAERHTPVTKPYLKPEATGEAAQSNMNAASPQSGINGSSSSTPEQASAVDINDQQRSTPKKLTPLGRYTQAQNIVIPTNSVVLGKEHSKDRTPTGSEVGVSRRGDATPRSSISLEDGEVLLPRKSTLSANSVEIIGHRNIASSSPIRSALAAEKAVDANTNPSAHGNNATSGEMQLPEKGGALSSSPFGTPAGRSKSPRRKSSSMKSPAAFAKDPKRRFSSGRISDEEDDDEDDAGTFSERKRRDNMLDILQSYPIKTLGPPAIEHLSRQEISVIVSMWQRLCAGITIYKHGRNGKPKEKVLFCDKAMSSLYWLSAGSKPYAEDEAEETKAQQQRRSSAFGLLSSAPAEPSTANRRFSLSKQDADKLIEFKDITEVRDNCSTDVMVRATAKGWLKFNGPTISILTNKRTLDMELTEESWNALFYGLRILVNYYQVSVPSSSASPYNYSRATEAFDTRSSEAALHDDFTDSYLEQSLLEKETKAGNTKKPRKSYFSFFSEG